MNAGMFFKRHGATILSVFASAGIVTTAVLSSKAGTKASKLLEKEYQKPETPNKIEQVKIVLPVYLPVVVVAGMSIAAVMGANVLNKRAQASLISAYALLKTSYNEYKKGVKNVYGEEGHEAIMKNIAAVKAENPHIIAYGSFRNSDLDFGDESPDNIRLFYDTFSKQYFESTVDKVLQAEYHLNRNFVMRGDASLAEYLIFLGLKPETAHEELGWNINDELFWIDFDHYKTVLDDGLECYIIDMLYEPEIGYLDY